MDDEQYAETWALRILDATDPSVASILTVGQLLRQAKTTLTPPEYARLFAESLVPFHTTIAYRLIAIAQHPVLAQPQWAGHLPAKWSVLSLLADVPPALLEAALRDGRVTAQIQTRDARILQQAALTTATDYVPGPAHTTRAQRAARLTRIRELVADGARGDQIAAQVGLTVNSCRLLMRREGIDCVADRVAGNRRPLNADRILDHMVASAASIAADIPLIHFAALSPDALPAYIDSLRRSTRSIIKLVATLTTYKERYVPAEKKQSVAEASAESDRGVDQPDGDAARAGDPAAVHPGARRRHC